MTTEQEMLNALDGHYYVFVHTEYGTKVEDLLKPKVITEKVTLRPSKKRKPKT
jgi:hypothetical protein